MTEFAPGFAITYRRGRGWCIPSENTPQHVRFDVTCNKAGLSRAQRRQIAPAQRLRLRFPKADFDVYRHRRGWKVYVFESSADIAITIHSRIYATVARAVASSINARGRL